MNARYRREGCPNCGNSGFPTLTITVGEEDYSVCQACAPKEAIVPWVQQYVMAGTDIVLRTTKVSLHVPVPWYDPPMPPPEITWVDRWADKVEGVLAWFRNLLRRKNG